MSQNDPVPDEHSHHSMSIVINTRTHEWAEKTISYEQLITLAYPGQPAEPSSDITVRYSRGHDGHGGGTLTAGHSVKVKKGMVFDVIRTTRS